MMWNLPRARSRYIWILTLFTEMFHHCNTRIFAFKPNASYCLWNKSRQIASLPLSSSLCVCAWGCVRVYVCCIWLQRGDDEWAVSSNGGSSFSNVMNMIFLIHHKGAHTHTNSIPPQPSIHTSCPELLLVTMWQEQWGISVMSSHLMFDPGSRMFI